MNNKILFLIRMDAKVTFYYNKKTIQIQCSNDEEMIKIFKRFSSKLNTNEDDFEYFYENKKIDNNSSISKLTNNKNQKEIVVTAERKSKIIKCPECICNDTIINIEDYRLKFYGCKYNHSVNKIFNDYDTSQKIEFSKIVCNENGCKNNQRDNPADFYKCFKCTQINKITTYLCYSCNKTHNKKHKTVEYNKKNYYCEEHFKKYIKYCKVCNKDLCEDCENNHKTKNHNTLNYNYINQNINNIKENLKDNIKESIDNLKVIVGKIKKFLDGTIKIFEDYYNIAEDIINKYEAYNKELKNHRIVESVLNLDASNQKILKDLNEIIKGENFKEQICKIIDIYIKDRNDFIKGPQNKNNINEEEEKNSQKSQEEIKDYSLTNGSIEDNKNSSRKKNAHKRVKSKPSINNK